jgi:DNA-binding transcriptional MerR regulator
MTQRRVAALDLGACVTIKEAAELLGVTPETLRNWDRADKLKPLRHPINGYRLYPLRELRALLHRTLRSRRGRPSGSRKERQA